MASTEKQATVAELTQRFTSSNAAVLTEYRGLSVAALKDLRRQLGDDASYAVTKNTLTAIAARDAGIDGIDELLVGPTAIAFISGDVATVAKGLRDFAKTNPQLVIKGGVLEGQFLDADRVKTLADLESREVLLARLAGGMQGALANAVSLFAAPLAQAARALGALQVAAGENPALIGGPGETVDAVSSDTEPTDTAPADADPSNAAPANTEPTNITNSTETDPAAAEAEPTTAADAAAEK